MDGQYNQTGYGMRLSEQVRRAIRTRHYSYRTERAYLHWVKRFILFHGKRHPSELAEGISRPFYPISPSTRRFGRRLRIRR